MFELFVHDFLNILECLNVFGKTVEIYPIKFTIEISL